MSILFHKSVPFTFWSCTTGLNGQFRIVKGLINLFLMTFGTLLPHFQWVEWYERLGPLLCNSDFSWELFQSLLDSLSLPWTLAWNHSEGRKKMSEKHRRRGRRNRTTTMDPIQELMVVFLAFWFFLYTKTAAVLNTRLRAARKNLCTTH